jgi:hypothetical protein
MGITPASMHTVIESLIVPSEARESVNSEVDY